MNHSAIPLNGYDGNTWNYFRYPAGKGHSKKEGKQDIHDELLNRASKPLPDGAVAVRLAWNCSPNRNWTMLWKPTGDTMGPVLGYARPNSPFHLNDDRITNLELHLNTETGRGYDVDVGMWWHPDESSPRQLSWVT